MLQFQRVLAALALVAPSLAVYLEQPPVATCGALHQTLGWCYGENRYGWSYGITITADLVCNQKTHATIQPFVNVTIRSSDGNKFSISPDPTFSGDALFQIEQGAYLYLDNVDLTGRETSTGVVHYGIRGITMDRQSTDYVYSYLYVTGSTFESFAGYQNGSAIYGKGGYINITDSVFQNNVATSEDGYADGGAIFIGGSYVYATNTQFLGNVADHRGGAVALNGSDQVLTGSNHNDQYQIYGTFECTTCTFTYDKVNGSDPIPLGGAIYSAVGNYIQVTGSSFTGNSAVNGYGASIYVESTKNTYLIDSTLSGNTALDGDVSVKNTTLTLQDTVISDFTSTSSSNTTAGCDAVSYDGTHVTVVTKGSNAADASCQTLQQDIKDTKQVAQSNQSDDGASSDSGLTGGKQQTTANSSGGKKVVAIGMTAGQLAGMSIGLAAAAVFLALVVKGAYKNKMERKRSAQMRSKANDPVLNSMHV